MTVKAALPVGIENFEEVRREIFDGLEISKEKELCNKFMGKFPDQKRN